MAPDGTPDETSRAGGAALPRLAQAEYDRRVVAVRAYKRQYMTPAVRAAMAGLGMSEAEYDRRLMLVLFPGPIVFTASGTTALE